MLADLICFAMLPKFCDALDGRKRHAVRFANRDFAFENLSRAGGLAGVTYVTK